MPTRRITGLKEGPSASNGSAIGHYQRHRAQPHRILLGSTVLEMREKVGKPAMAPSPAVQSSSVSCCSETPLQAIRTLSPVRLSPFAQCTRLLFSFHRRVPIQEPHYLHRLTPSSPAYLSRQVLPKLEFDPSSRVRFLPSTDP
ncbi:hypothetical protein Bbelb_059080 [Branchiostoma belcheri]|nr:hypothetical protein Bbelb_446280 [Branchiostoma belcheri]KAI8517327.1 hypothetical protein Bbelb_059080 [Branchiostoma belcheri]